MRKQADKVTCLFLQEKCCMKRYNGRTFQEAKDENQYCQPLIFGPNIGRSNDHLKVSKLIINFIFMYSFMIISAPLRWH